MKIEQLLSTLFKIKESLANKSTSSPFLNYAEGREAISEVMKLIGITGTPESFSTQMYVVHQEANIQRAIEKLEEIIKSDPILKSEIGVKDGKLYNVKLKSAQEEADKAIREINADISNTTDPIKLNQLTKRYEALQDGKRQLTSLNDQFSADPSSVSPAEIQRLATRIPEFAKNPNITTPEQDRFAAAQSGAQAASALPTITPAQKTAVGSGTDTSASDALTKKLHESTMKAAQAAASAAPKPATTLTAFSLNPLDVERLKNVANEDANRLINKNGYKDPAEIKAIKTSFLNSYGLNENGKPLPNLTPDAIRNMTVLGIVPSENPTTLTAQASTAVTPAPIPNSNTSVPTTPRPSSFTTTTTVGSRSSATVPPLSIPNTGGNNALPETPRTLSQAAAAARAAEPGIGEFKGDKDQTFMEALTHSTAQNLREALNKPLLQYPENIFPGMSEAEVDGLKRLTDLAKFGDPQAQKIMMDIEKNNPELLKVFNDGINILQSAQVPNADLKEYMGKAADLTGTAGSAITPQDMQNYQNPLDALKERIRERMFQDFQKNDLRRFQDMFTGKQSFFGSRRKEIQKDLMNNFQDKLADLNAKFGVENEQKAYERTLADRMRMLQAGGQFGGLNAQAANTALNANAQDIARAQAMSGTSLAKQNQDLMRQNLRRQLAQDQSTTSLRANEAAMNAGAVERANELDRRKEKYMKFREKVDHRVNNATKMLDAARGFQMNYPAPPMMAPNTFNPLLLSTPQPTQVYNTSNNGMFGAAATLAGSLDKALNPQSLNRFKSGGVVERKFLASGGVAENLMRQKMAQAMTPQPQPQPAADPYNQFMDTAQTVNSQLMNRAQNPANPSGAWLRNYGASLMAADPNKTATQQIGEALQQGNAAYDQTEAQPANDYQSALAVQKAMINTQQSVEEFKSNQRMKQEQMSLKRAALGSMLGNRSNIESGGGYGIGDSSLAEFDAKGRPTPRGRQLASGDKKAIDESRMQISAINELTPLLDSIEKIIPNVNSGFVRGGINNIPGGQTINALTGAGSSEDIGALDATGNAIVGALEKLNPGRAAVARLELLKKSKMGMHLPKETNMKILNELRYMKEMVKNRAYFVQDAYDNGIHAATAEAAYNKYIDALYHGKKDVTPMDFIPKLDLEKRDNLLSSFIPFDSFKDKLDRNEFATNSELKVESKDKSKGNEIKQTIHTNNLLDLTEDDIREFAKDEGISYEEAKRELIEAMR